MQVNVPASLMTFLGGLVAALQVIDIQLPPDAPKWVSIAISSLTAFIGVYIGKTNAGTFHQVPGTRKKQPLPSNSTIIKP